MKLDKTGLLMVAGAALVLLAVVKKSTAGALASGAPGQAQSAIGANATSFLGRAIPSVNIGAMLPGVSTAGALGTQLPGGVTLFGNGTFDVNGTYVDPGQVAYDTKTGQVQESPFSGMYGILSPLTQGFGGYTV